MGLIGACSRQQAFQTPIKKGNTIRDVSDELLNVLTLAYREAAGGAIEA
jgi:hypothetical protein